MRSPLELAAMRRAGQAVRAALDAASQVCAAGATTAEVDAAAAAELTRLGASAPFLDQSAEEQFGRSNGATDRRFPAVTCISVNEELVHGVPGPRVIREGDLVTIDCGARVDGWCADAAVTVAVGRVDDARRRLLDTTCAMLDEAIASVRPGVAWSRIARRLQDLADEAGLAVVSDYVGHGIGRSLHEVPEVPCHAMDPSSGRDFTLRPGMTLAIEPMLVLGSTRTVLRDDGWTVATADGLPAAHVEHTIAVTRGGAEVLTAPASTGCERGGPTD